MGEHCLCDLVVLIQKLTRDNHRPHFVQSELSSHLRYLDTSTSHTVLIGKPFASSYEQFSLVLYSPR